MNSLGRGCGGFVYLHLGSWFGCGGVGWFSSGRDLDNEFVFGLVMNQFGHVFVLFGPGWVVG